MIFVLISRQGVAESDCLSQWLLARDRQLSDRVQDRRNENGVFKCLRRGVRQNSHPTTCQSETLDVYQCTNRPCLREQKNQQKLAAERIAMSCSRSSLCA